MRSKIALMKIERGTRVDLFRVNYECRARWQNAPPGSWRERYISVGVLDDGRWYVSMTGHGGDTRVYQTKTDAWTVVQNLMTTYDDGPWQQVSCYGTPLARRVGPPPNPA